MSGSDLKGRVALVTGASRGVGRGIARRLARAGATVVVGARSLDRAVEFEGTLHETVALIESDGGRALPIRVDLSDRDDRDSLVERTIAAAGGLDILVNNAGTAHYATIAEMDDETFEGTLDCYFRAPFALARAAIPHMQKSGSGWILNVGSVTAQRPFKPYDDWARMGGATIYAAVKAGLARLTQGLAAELEASNIAVHLIAPSTAIWTPGAERYTPADYPTEPIEYLAEAALDLCARPAGESTGLLAHSLHYYRERGLSAVDFESGEPLQVPEIPEYAHPEIMAAGE